TLCLQHPGKYNEEDLSPICAFCSSRSISDPCIKLWGPKKQSRIESPRPSITNYSVSIQSKDVQILQHVYSDVYLSTPNAAPLSLRLLFRTFASHSLYGQSINHFGLRNALLAYVGITSEVATSEECLEYSTRACKSLRL